MTDYTATVYELQRKQDKTWKPYIIDETEYRVRDNAVKEMKRLRLRFPDDEFRINVKTVTYTIVNEVLDEAA